MMLESLTLLDKAGSITVEGGNLSVCEVSMKGVAAYLLP